MPKKGKHSSARRAKYRLPEEEAVASADEDGSVGAQSQARSSTPEATAKQRTHPWAC